MFVISFNLEWKKDGKVNKTVQPSKREEKKREGEKFDGYSREYKRGTPEEQERMPYNTSVS